MKITMMETIFTAAKAGLLAGAFTACGGTAPPAESPEGEMQPMPEEAAAAEADSTEMPAAEGQEPTAEGKDCCKGMNECKGKGGCRAGEHSCKGQNECKGQGGCNSHCPS
jgi:hypothetical protein